MRFVHVRQFRLFDRHALWFVLANWLLISLVIRAGALAEPLTSPPAPLRQSTQKSQDNSQARNVDLGINFAGPKDWSTELPMADIFRHSRAWISQRQGASWGQGPPLKLDSQGNVKTLEPNCFAETPIINVSGGHYPSGAYQLSFQGNGKIEIRGAGELVSLEQDASGQSRGLIEVDSIRGPMWLRIMQTDPDDPIRDIHVVVPGHGSGTQNPWRANFIETWSMMSTFRSMDWQHTNESTIATIDELPKVTDQRFTEHGYPIEWIIDFANRTQRNPWICIPHLANDALVRNIARLCRDALQPGLKLYVEYSNEVWNDQFAQAKYAAEQGIALGFAKKPWEARWAFTAKRSIEIFRIFEDVFGATDRFVRVLPSQSANPYVGQQIIERALSLGDADALAIAPYISLNVKPVDADAVIRGGVNEVFRRLREESLPKTVDAMKRNAELAREHGLRLIAYEAGQHAVGIQAAQNIAALTEILTTANGDDRMTSLYADYLSAWEDAGGGLMCLFSSTSQWDKYGSWGLRQYSDEPLMSSPKFRGVAEFAKSRKLPGWQ
ncbi:MAG: hypothetical protein AAF539_04940 [Planctomycetota bacterium]